MTPRAAVYDSFGPPGVLTVVEVPDVHPAAGEVRVRVRAVGLNPYDFKARSGLVPSVEPVFPRGLGGDFAGTVDAVGEDASYFDGSRVGIGDHVLGWAEGTLREQLLVPAAHIARKPPAVPWEVAGSLSTPAQTADAALNLLAIGPDDTVLLSAAAGSVGLVYAQLAIARGARVIGTASEANVALLESFGVVATAYGLGLAERVRALAPTGITAVQDNFGRETIDAGLELGLPPSRICSIVDHAAVAALGLASPGRYAKSAERLERYANMVAGGRLVLPIQVAYPLARVREAFELLEGRHLSGKVVITP